MLMQNCSKLDSLCEHEINVICIVFTILKFDNLLRAFCTYPETKLYCILTSGCLTCSFMVNIVLILFLFAKKFKFHLAEKFPEILI